ncbi:MAG: leucine-rich repeat domain-containing protein [Ruminococcus sp.]|nr:leucine-rich repeat domain-containing protein [Ruminococcus sp.]
MFKKLLSCAAAFVLAFGGAQALPITELFDTAVTARAEDSDFIREINDDGTVTITGYTGSDINVVIPEKLGGRTVTVLDGQFHAVSGNVGFTSNTNIKSVVLPKTMKVINASAFRNCSNLESIKLNEGLETIKGGVWDGAFEGCTSLKSIEIPSTVKYIGDWAFNDCDSLTSVTIPDSVICDNTIYDMFSYCDNLQSVKIGKGFSIIPNSMFSGCTKLKNVEIPDTVTYMQRECFYKCTSLENIKLPQYLENIGFMSFQYCSSLKSIDIPHSVTTIDDDAFLGCSSLKTITMHEGIDYIGYSAFAGCPFDEITIPRSVTYINTMYLPIQIIEGRKIYCYFNNAGEDYATKYGFDYEILPTNINDISWYIWGDYPYNGKNPTLVMSDNDISLIEGIDYNVTYKKSADRRSYKVTAKGIGNYTGTLEKTYIISGIDIKNCSITLNESSYSYNGVAKKPKVTVKYDDLILKENVDYKVSYSNNINAGTAEVLISATNDHVGSKAKSFKINAVSLAKSTVTGIANKYYTGKAITQAPTVKLGNKTLKKGTDYTVTFKNNKAVGKATVTIKGKGNYSGTVSKTFKILPKKTTLKTAASPKKGQLKVTYSKQTNITGYQITYSTDKSFKSKASKASAKTSKTISGLKSGKTYYVKVRTYKTVSGTKYYSGYSAVKKIKVK